MITVILYGELGKLYGKYHKYAVSNVPEAIKALSANFKGFAQSIRKDGEYRVVVDKKVISEDDITRKAIEIIKIIPLVQGSGKGAGSIIAGIALVALAWWNPMSWGLIANTQAGLVAGELAISAMTSIGTSLILGGVAQMMTKTPSLASGADRPNNVPSYAFDGPVNTTAQGNPVPLAYGKILAGSQVISAGLEVR